MVSLAISGHADSAHSSDDPNYTSCLQDTTIWYPDTPGSEYSFFGVSAQPDPTPLQTGIFSDSAGNHLPHVVGITVWVDTEFLSLRVDLDEPLHGQTKVDLGVSESTLELFRDDYNVKEHSFSIRSGDGERIIGVDANYYHGGAFLDFKVCPLR
jgi:hypothetical protein